MPSKDELKMMQSLPLEVKVLKTQQRIREWVTHFGVEGVYISFSGGKDSTVLLHLVRELYPDVEAVFVNTGLEYPEIQRFVKTFDNVRILYPEMNFKQVLCEYGYPIISKDVAQTVYDAKSAGINSRVYSKFLPDSEYNIKYKGHFSMVKWKPLLNVDFKISHQCCNQMKKKPAKKYEKETGKKPITGTMACESRLRENMWCQKGCNSFDVKRPLSKPMSFWTEQDVLQYIKENNISIPSVYGEIIPMNYQEVFEGFTCQYCTTGCIRTGCIFCGFGAHLFKGESNFQKLKRTHPKQYDFCINGGSYDVDGIWKPDINGLGMGHVFDELNKIYGENFIKYK